MYSYLYDSFLSHEKYFRQLSTIETLLIVVVGTDKLVGQVVDTLAKYPEVALGIVPLGQPIEIAKNFGIPTDLVGACYLLANRLIRYVSLGKVNNRYFLYQAEVAGQDVILECDGNFKIHPTSRSSIKINNILAPQGELLQTTVEPRPAGLLVKRPVSPSVFVSQKVFIDQPKNKRIKIIADDEKEVQAPATVELTGIKLKIIVGKGKSREDVVSV
ncbi:hypothetical protein HY224_00930 [Candidatus Uhrbacteria bacterium]|nr:hypothetical protein [Candidatus Uhrbacteria bacterium]